MNIPVVYLTAHPDKSILERVKLTAPLVYVTKPFREKVLLIATDMALYRHKMERGLGESKRRLETTLRSIADAVIIRDVHGNVMY